MHIIRKSIDKMSVSEIREALVDGGFFTDENGISLANYDLATNLATRIKNAATTGALLWTRERITSTRIGDSFTIFSIYKE